MFTPHYHLSFLLIVKLHSTFVFCADAACMECHRVDAARMECHRVEAARMECRCVDAGRMECRRVDAAAESYL